MIHEHHQEIPDDFRVSVPTVAKWEPYPECPKCGSSLGSDLPILRRILAAWGRCAQNTAYCAGDQNSQAFMPTINIGTGQIGTTALPILCFGIVEEHLHVKCARCGFDWLMAVKGGK